VLREKCAGHRANDTAAGDATRSSAAQLLYEQLTDTRGELASSQGRTKGGVAGSTPPHWTSQKIVAQ